MKNELENVKTKESKTSLKITETDRQRLFDIAFDVAEMNGKKKLFTPLEAFRLCLSLTETTIKERGIWVYDGKDFEKHTEKLKSMIVEDDQKVH